jgi:hypothetical protein
MIAPDPVDQSTQEIIATFLWSGRHHVLDTYWQAIEALGPALTPPQSRAAGCHSFIETNGTVAPGRAASDTPAGSLVLLSHRCAHADAPSISPARRPGTAATDVVRRTRQRNRSRHDAKRRSDTLRNHVAGAIESIAARLSAHGFDGKRRGAALGAMAYRSQQRGSTSMHPAIQSASASRSQRHILAMQASARPNDSTKPPPPLASRGAVPAKSYGRPS